MNWFGVSERSSLNTYCLKTLKDSLEKTEDGTSPESLLKWMNWGMTCNGNASTARISESHNGGNVCLSSVLEKENILQKYFLSDVALQGVIQRTKKWKKLTSPLFVYLRETGETRRIRRLSLAQLIQLQEELGHSGTRLTLRTLTPEEKERLQGFPEGWTAVETGV